VLREIVVKPQRLRLRDIAHARSGDKGNHANIGVVACTPEAYRFLGQVLTETRVAEFFLPLRPRQVQRFELPGILAYNFLLLNVLGGAASQSLRIDSQGKVLSAALLELELPVPADFESLLPPAGGPLP
jgi:hypothetical protein